MKKIFLSCLILSLSITFLFSCSDSNSSSPDPQVPLAPTNLAVEVLSSTSVTLSWTENSDNETGFILEYSLNTDFDPSLEVALEADSASVVISELQASTEYFFRIYAFNDVGNSVYSAVQNITTLDPPLNPPNAPSDLVLNVLSDTEISVSWDDNSDNEDRFVLEWSLNSDLSNPFSASFSANANSFTVSSLSPETQYYFRVKANNTAGDSGWSLIVNTTTVPSVSGSITINSNAIYTNSLNVTLNINVSGVTKMRFSNDNSIWSNPEDYNTTKSWTLSSTDGTKTVYARFENSLGTQFYMNDNILLDRTPPTVNSFRINNGDSDTYSTSIQLNNDVIGAVQMRFSLDQTNWTTWQSYNNTKSYTLNGNENNDETVYAQFKDDHENIVSTDDEIYFDSITRIKISAKYIDLEYDSDPEAGEIYWDFYVLLNYAAYDYDRFVISERESYNWVSMNDGDTYSIPASENVILEIQRGANDWINIYFMLHEADDDNNDDYSATGENVFYESVNWGAQIGNRSIYVGSNQYGNGPTGTMYYTIEKLD